MTSRGTDPASRGFAGTEVTDDGRGPAIVSHRQRVAVVRGPDRGLEREVCSKRLTIGTVAGNDVVLSDPKVSRRHCEIEVREGRYLLRDLGSTNGTLVNGTAVVEAFLDPGTTLRVGSTELVFEPRKKWLRFGQSKEDRFGELVGASVPMRHVFGVLAKVAPTDLSCILLGETGTGKELAARALHAASARADRPFVVVDCGAATETLVEAELFGHEKGAFTSADRARAGAFELADGGTIFLDEIGDLSLELQPKLLRALERREVKRLGAGRYQQVNVRVVAATHRDLHAMVDGGSFREDLFYRLAEVVVELPPLRHRREDIALITSHILASEAERGGAVRAIDPEALDALTARPWPGNVRELRNVLRRALALAASDRLRRADLAHAAERARASDAPPPPELSAPQPDRVAAVLDDIGSEVPIKEARERWLAPFERDYLLRLLRRSQGDLDLAARSAGLHRKSLERLLRQHGLKSSDWRDRGRSR